jgi:hypothetical protein
VGADVGVRVGLEARASADAVADSDVAAGADVEAYVAEPTVAVVTLGVSARGRVDPSTCRYA